MIRNSRGESLIELLVTTVIISLTLFAILSAFLSGRTATVQSWNATAQNELAVQVMEQLKATPYSTLLTWEQQCRVNGQAAGLDPRQPPFDFHLDPQYAAYEVRLDLLAYETYPLNELIKIVVHVGQVEQASLMTKR